MIIQCDQCDRKFRVDDSKIKPPGSRVRCSKCGNVFFVEKNDTPKVEETAPETGISDTPSPNLDNLQVDSNRKEVTEPNQIEVGISEPAKTDVSADIEPAASTEQEDKQEQVWSIDDEQQTSSLDIEQPSIDISTGTNTDLDSLPAEVKFEPGPEPEPEPELKADLNVANGLSLDTDSPQDITEPDNSSVSWASLDSEEDSKTSDDDLTPPAQSISDMDNKQVDTAPITSEFPQSPPPAEPSMDYATDSATDPVQQVAEEPSLDLDIEKVQQADNQQAFQSAHGSEAPLDSDLSVDQQTMSQVQAESYGGGAQQEFDSSSEAPSIRSTLRPQKKSFGSKIGSFITKIIVAACIIVILGSVGLILAINLEVIPKEKAKELRSFLVANLPIDIEDPLEGINITSTPGQWINSSNGPLFVVQGNVTNLTDNIVNYIQLNAQYTNNGQVLYDTKLYAGNTFTGQELQTLSLNEINERLNRKNGDIDFSDPRKLAGTNYNLMPGDSIQFYSIFPSKTQILGLKHNIEVIDAELILVDNSG